MSCSLDNCTSSISSYRPKYVPSIDKPMDASWKIILLPNC
jgi:hypothetical protein